MTLFCTSNFPWALESISYKFIDNFGTHLQKGSPAVVTYYL